MTEALSCCPWTDAGNPFTRTNSDSWLEAAVPERPFSVLGALALASSNRSRCVVRAVSVRILNSN